MGLVKVTVETASGQEMDSLKEALQKLNRSDPSVSFAVNSRGEYILSTCGQVHLERCLKDLKDDYFRPAIETEIQVSDPIIPFRETIISKRLTNRIARKDKENYHVVDSESESEEEKAREEMTVAEIIEHEKKMEEFNEQLTYQKELLRNEQQLDPFMEKLLEIKLTQGDEKMQQKANELKGWAKDKTANKCISIKVRAVGLDNEVTMFLEKNMRGLRDCYEICGSPNPQSLPNAKIQRAVAFVTQFFETMKEQRTSLRLMMLIKNHTSCFGPRRLGSNLILNRFGDKQRSLFNLLQTQIGSQLIFPQFLIKYE